MALLEVLTRCYRRPQMLMENIRGLLAQSDPDWEQTFLVDMVGRGVGASHLMLRDADVRGQYVWVLDDDDVCIYPELVADLRRLARPKPGVVMVRMDHGAELGVLPDAAVWGQAPQEGRLGMSSFIVRRDVWQRHAGAWESMRYASDYDFIADVWSEGPAVVWHDVVASRTQRGRSIGAAE